MTDTMNKTDRRSFLGLAATAAGAAALAAGPAAAATEIERADERVEAGGYRETEHVRAAYDRMRF